MAVLKIKINFIMVFSQTEHLLRYTQIEEIEKLVGLIFPKAYKDHLLKYNGGRCVPNIFSFEEDGKITESDIDWFLAIYNGEYDNLKTYIEIYKLEESRLPIRILPIAHDSGGNLICISCMGDDTGYIYFWNHEREFDFCTENLYLISISFQDFVDGLKKI